jgi:tRNA-dihydrouridine synthase B
MRPPVLNHARTGESVPNGSTIASSATLSANLKRRLSLSLSLSPSLNLTPRANISRVGLRRHSLIKPMPDGVSRLPTLCVRQVPVYGDLVLAPMAGFSDVPFRTICREFGSAMSYTEFASVEGITWDAERTRRILAYREFERPVVFQIFGADEDALVTCAQKIEAWGPDIIDINLGCPSHKISGRGAGAGLLRDPNKIARIFARLSKAVRVPVTAKIRLGWDHASRNYLDVARILEDNGAALIAVHGRTRMQNYSEPADWDAIARVKQLVKIPVLGNGGVRCAADIDRMKCHTGCDGVMIGQGAMGNPWIFQRRDFGDVPFADKAAVFRRHLAAMAEFYGEEKGVVLFRKHAVRYLRGVPHSAQMRIALLTRQSLAEVMRALDAFELYVCAVEAGERQDQLNARRLENVLIEN